MPQLPPVYLYGQPIETVTSILYLGVTIDNRLNFCEHISNKIEAATAKLGLLRKKIYDCRGPNPLWLKYAYEAVAVPTLTYACHVWAHRMNASHKKKLVDLKRMACNIITSFVGRPPTNGLEIILGIRPLLLTIEMSAIEKAIAIKGKFKTAWNTMVMKSRSCSRQGFRYRNEMMAKKYGVTIDDIDRINKRQPYSYFLKEELPHPDITIYTDGSKMDGKVGFAAVIEGNFSKELSGSLSADATVFQAEIQAILVGVQCLLDEGIKKSIINIYSDSMSSIQCLTSVSLRSKLGIRTKEKLNLLCKNNLVALTWVKAHVGIAGNERADLLAKEGRLKPMEITTLKPLASIKAKMHGKANLLWKNEWLNSKGRDQTKFWYKGPQPDKHKEVIKLDKETLNIFTQFITGFNRLGRHMHKVNATIQRDCRLCGEPTEDSIHLATDCDALLPKSRLILGRFHEDHSKWSISQLIEFLREPVVWGLLRERRMVEV